MYRVTVSLRDDAMLETQIGEWRSYASRRAGLVAADVEQLEGRLRHELATLAGAGLAPDEAFLVAVKRIGWLDAVSRQFAGEPSERVWKQMEVAGHAARGNAARLEGFVAIGLAFAAAAAFKVPALFGYQLGGGAEGFYARNFSLFVLPALVVFLAWKRRIPPPITTRLAAPFVVAAVLVNLYPFRPGGTTEVLAALHVPVALWLIVGIAYTGNHWADAQGRMNFVRFTGELAIYYALIAFGGIVFTGFTSILLKAIDLQAPWLFSDWIVPCGALGAVLISAWLVEAKQGVVESMAPVLTRVFTPLFALLLLGFLATMGVTGHWFDVARNVLISIDLLLVVVLGLVVYAVSARDPHAPPGAFDILQLVLILSALVVDVIALAAIASRISEFGFSANKVAALGENLVLLVNLAWSCLLYWRFVRGHATLAALERWQTAYLPVYSGWAAVVVAAFPPIFGWA